ncbi:MAG: energy transducer TonB [Deltaproteobacteria bacterium]|nr:energy transducer TonB [Deltaproteobacteria bacterium]
MGTTDQGPGTRDNGPKSLIKKSLFISTLLHVILLGLLIFGLPGDVERATGDSKNVIISVSLIGDSPQPRERVGLAELRGTPPHQSGAPINRRGEREGRGGDLPAADLVPQDRRAEAVGVITYQEAGEGGASLILQQIRNRIERNKYYPLTAKRSKMEGSPLIEFKIKPDGSLEYVLLKQTSGSPILDEAAAMTVQQASPFPFYPEPIALNIHYTLAR